MCCHAYVFIGCLFVGNDGPRSEGQIACDASQFY